MGRLLIEFNEGDARWEITDVQASICLIFLEGFLGEPDTIT